MKIIIIDSSMHEKIIGGAQVILFPLIKGLVGKGHEVHLVTVGSPNSALATAQDQSGAITHTDLKSEWSLPVEKAQELARWLNKLRPDIYIISVSADVGWLTLPFLDPGIRTLAIGHNNIDAFYQPAAHYRQFLTSVIGVSREICRNYELVSGIDPRRIQWIPYGVQSASVQPAANESSPLRLTYIGRIEEAQKRISDVCLLIKELSSSKITYHFQIVGDGSMRSWLENELAEEVRSGKVNFTGWISNEYLPGFYQKSDIFVQTSSYEGFSIALTEAMANGCCPIVTDIPSGSVQIIQDGVNGYLVSVGDISGFIERIKILNKDRVKLHMARSAAWETGCQYSLEKMIDRYDALFRSVINEYPETDRTPNPEFPVMPSCRSLFPDWLRKVKLCARTAWFSIVSLKNRASFI